jgi:glyoxylase I family protein
MDKLHRVAPAMLEEWSRTKRAPKHAAWLHEKEFTGE